MSLLESILDFQFEVITTHLADGGRLPQRSKRFNAHAYLSAPYGVYPTEDGYLALAMGDLMKIARLIGCTSIEAYSDPSTWFTRRDEIQQILADQLAMRPTAQWLAVLQAAGVWCSDVFDYAKLVAHEAWEMLKMDQIVRRDGVEVHTTRCPIRIDNEILLSPKAAPRVGEDNNSIHEALKHA